MFDPFIAWYLFFAGTGSAALCITALTIGAWRRKARKSAPELFTLLKPGALIEITDPAEPDTGSYPLRVRARGGLAIAAFCLVTACILLLSSFSNPLIVWRVILTPFASLVSVGALAVTLCTLLTCGLAVATFMYLRLPRIVFDLALVITSLLALVTIVYAGLLLTSFVAVDLWRSWLLPPLFVVSSFSCGLAATLLPELIYLSTRTRSFRLSWLLLVWLHLAELCILAGFLYERTSVDTGATATSLSSVSLLLGGAEAGAFWLGLVVAGLVVPLVCHPLYRLLRLEALVLIGSASTLVGGFFVRQCILNGGLMTPILPP